MNNLTIIFQFSIPFGVISFIFFLELIFIQFSSKTGTRHYRKNCRQTQCIQSFYFVLKFLLQSVRICGGVQRCLWDLFGVFSNQKNRHVVLLMVKIPTLCVNSPFFSVGTTVNCTERISMSVLFSNACIPQLSIRIIIVLVSLSHVLFCSQKLSSAPEFYIFKNKQKATVIFPSH